jgi:hypothetical protein
VVLFGVARLSTESLAAYWLGYRPTLSRLKDVRLVSLCLDGCLECALIGCGRINPGIGLFSIYSTITRDYMLNYCTTCFLFQTATVQIENTKWIKHLCSYTKRFAFQNAIQRQAKQDLPSLRLDLTCIYPGRREERSQWHIEVS